MSVFMCDYMQSRTIDSNHQHNGRTTLVHVVNESIIKVTSTHDLKDYFYTITLIEWL